MRTIPPAIRNAGRAAGLINAIISIPVVGFINPRRSNAVVASSPPRRKIEKRVESGEAGGEKRVVIDPNDLTKPRQLNRRKRAALTGDPASVFLVFVHGHSIRCARCSCGKTMFLVSACVEGIPSWA